MIAVLLGPIKHWWDENWQTDEHHIYSRWREEVSKALVAHGLLVYRPHEAFKGSWDERGQTVNDTAISLADICINMTPPGTPSEGTDKEMLLCEDRGKTVIYAPPPTRQEASVWADALDRIIDEVMCART